MKVAETTTSSSFKTLTKDARGIWCVTIVAVGGLVTWLSNIKTVPMTNIADLHFRVNYQCFCCLQ